MSRAAMMNPIPVHRFTFSFIAVSMGKIAYFIRDL